jgi:hypothetical protein
MTHGWREEMQPWRIGEKCALEQKSNSLLFRPQLKAHNSMLKVIENNCKSNSPIPLKKSYEGEREREIDFLVLRIRWLEAVTKQMLHGDLAAALFDQ